MANGHGGYRKPSNPAPVSGPGAHSKRTDGRAAMMDLPDAAYGENKTFREAQSGAPMGARIRSTGGASPIPPSSITPINAPSQQPDIPVTDGAQYGPGAGPSALNLPTDLARADAQDLKMYLPVLLSIANRDDTPRGTKMFVRTIIANL